MKKYLWKIILAIGVVPFVIPFVLGVYRMSIESWTMGEWLVMYSFVYWPTYLVGAVLTLWALIKLAKK